MKTLNRVLILTLISSPIVQTCAWAGSGLNQNLFGTLHLAPEIGGKQNGGTFAPPNENSDSRSGLDSRLTAGYLLGGKFLIGANINYGLSSTSRDAVVGGPDSLKHSITRFQYGPTVGFVSGGFHTTLSYLLSAKRTQKLREVQADGVVAVDQELVDKGSGYQIGTGYTFNVSKSVSIGPSLMYRSIKYKTQTLKDARTPASNYTGKSYLTKAVEAELVPMVGIGLKF